VRQKRYTRLKVNLLLRVVVISGAVAGGIMLLLRALGEREILSAIYCAVARNLFGRTEEEAQAFFTQVLLPNWAVIFCGLFILTMVIGFYLLLGKLTGWFGQISESVHVAMEDPAKAISLPRELDGLEADLNAARLRVFQREKEAVESAQRSRDLVAYLAHDLKTPLTSVVGYLNLLREQPELDAGQRAKYTGIALEKAVRLEELIGEFFDINRLELDSVETSGQLLNLSMLLKQLAEEFWPIFEEKGLTFHPSILPNLSVWGDPDKLVRVFDNVLRNAVNYSVPHGVVGLRAFRQGGELVVTVDNEGLEIPESELSKIFQKFYRLDAARSTQTGGLGLGLAIAKEIVERHRGTIRAESNGKRVTFTVILPAR